jgi:hypothetical protein
VSSLDCLYWPSSLNRTLLGEGYKATSRRLTPPSSLHYNIFSLYDTQTTRVDTEWKVRKTPGWEQIIPVNKKIKQWMLKNRTSRGHEPQIKTKYGTGCQIKTLRSHWREYWRAERVTFRESGLTATKHSGPRREEGRTEVASRTSESAVTCEGALVPDKGGSGVVGGGAGISWEALI